MELFKWKLVLFYNLMLWISAVTATIKSSEPRSYAFSYATPDGSARYEASNGVGGLHGGYQYRTPDGGVVAVRYTDDHGYRATGDSYERHYDLPGSFRRRHSYTYGSTPQDQYLTAHPKKSYAFSYSTADGQMRYESRSPEGVVKGGYRYTAPDGTKIAVRYIADKDGFRTTNDNQIYHPSARVLNPESFYRVFDNQPRSASAVRPQASAIAAPPTYISRRTYSPQPITTSPAQPINLHPMLNVEAPPYPGTVSWPPVTATFSRAPQLPLAAAVRSPPRGFSYAYSELPSAHTPFSYIQPATTYYDFGHDKTARYADGYRGGFPFNFQSYFTNNYLPYNPLQGHRYEINF